VAHQQQWRINNVHGVNDGQLSNRFLDMWQWDIDIGASGTLITTILRVLLILLVPLSLLHQSVRYFVPKLRAP
jgi:hypothetical protein